MGATHMPPTRRNKILQPLGVFRVVLEQAVRFVGHGEQESAVTRHHRHDPVQQRQIALYDLGIVHVHAIGKGGIVLGVSQIRRYRQFAGIQRRNCHHELQTVCVEGLHLLFHIRFFILARCCFER